MTRPWGFTIEDIETSIDDVRENREAVHEFYDKEGKLCAVLISSDWFAELIGEPE